MRPSTRPLLSTKPQKAQSGPKHAIKVEVGTKLQCTGEVTMKRRRISGQPRCELRAHIVGGLLQRRGCGITKSGDQTTRLSRGRCVFGIKAGVFWLLGGVWLGLFCRTKLVSVGERKSAIVEQRTVVIKWVRMKQVVWRAMLPSRSGR